MPRLTVECSIDEFARAIGDPTLPESIDADPTGGGLITRRVPPTRALSS